MASSAIFTPYRSLGVICEGQQMCLYSLGTESFFVTSTGNAFQVYNCDHLGVSMVSASIKHTISHIACFKDYTFTATEVGIVCWKRGKAFKTLCWTPEPSVQAGISSTLQRGETVSLLALGDYLLSLHDTGKLYVWSIRSIIGQAPEEETLVNSVSLPEGTRPTCLLHPATYLNKVAVGTEAGTVQIVNIRTGKMVYECSLAAAAPAAVGSGVGGMLGGGGAGGILASSRAAAAVVAAAAGGVPVTCLAQSDTVDVIAAGLADGRIIIHNLKADKKVCTFRHGTADGSSSSSSTRSAGQDRVTSIAFSQNNSMSFPCLLSCTETGAMAVWNLQNKALQSLLPAAHDAPIQLVAFLPGQPVCLTAGADNAVHMWRLDAKGESSPPSKIRSRAGHFAPPKCIRYYGGQTVASLASGANASACEIASAGGDRTLRIFHTAREGQNGELSQGHIVSKAKELGVHPNSLRLPPITALAVSDRRYSQWADVVTAHAGESRAFLWSWENKRLEDRALQLPNAAETVQSLAITPCGNFAFLGGSMGSLVLYNVQSGARRAMFPKDPMIKDGRMAAKGKKVGALNDRAVGAPDRDTGKGSKNSLVASLRAVDSFEFSSRRILGQSVKIGDALVAQEAAAAAAAANAATVVRHRSAVTGVAVDGLNKTVVSADIEGRVIFWDFSSHAAVATLQLPAGAASLVLQRDSSLAAILCDDFLVRVVDLSTRRIVRSFAGHSNRLTDAAFSPDGRWLLTGSLDRTVRVWDLPTGRCVDWMQFQHAPVSLTFSPTGEYLVTAHVDCVGLNLWANKAHFSTVILDRTPRAPVSMDSPSAMDSRTALAQTDAEAAAALAGSSGGAAAGGAGAEEGEGETVKASVAGGGSKGAKGAEAAGGLSGSKRRRGGEGDALQDDFFSRAAGQTAADLAEKEAEESKKKKKQSADSAADTGKLSGKKRSAAEAGEEEEEEKEEMEEEEALTPAQQAMRLRPMAHCRLTLSGLPPSAWQNLSKLDIIAARNKPKAPPTKPVSAPFFLSTTGGLNPTFAPPPAAGAGAAGAGAGASAGKSGDAGAAEKEEWSSSWHDADEGEEEEEAEAGADSGEEGEESAGGQKKKGSSDVGHSSSMLEDTINRASSSGRMIKSSGFRVARSELAQALKPLAELLQQQHESSSTGSSSSKHSPSFPSISGFYTSLTAGLKSKNKEVQAAAKQLQEQLTEACDAVGLCLAGSSPSSTDAAVRSLCLGPEDEPGCQLLQAFLLFFAEQCSQGLRFELVQAVLQLFLQVHGEVLAGLPALSEGVAALQTVQAADSERLRSMLDKGLCMISIFLGL